MRRSSAAYPAPSKVSGCALAIGTTETLQFQVGEVKAVHRHHLRHIRESLVKGKRERRLASARWPDQTEQFALPISQEIADARYETRRNNRESRRSHGHQCIRAALIDGLQAKDIKNGGLSPRERAQLTAAQSKASADINSLENNNVQGNPSSASSLRMQADVQRNAN